MRTKPRRFYKLMFLRMYPRPFAMELRTRKRKFVYAKLRKLFLINVAYLDILKDFENYRKEKMNLSENPNS